MSRPREMNIKAAVMDFFTAFLLSLGMSLALLRSLLPQQAILPAVLLCAVFTLLFHGLFVLPFKRKWALPLAVLGGLCLWAAFGGGPLFTAIQLGKAGYLAFQGVPDATAPYTDTARWAVCLLFSLLGAALAWDHTLPLTVFTAVTVISLAFLLNAQQEILLYALPAAAGVLLMTASQQGKRPAALPVALLLALAAFLLMPGKPEEWTPLKNAADSLRQFVEDYLLFNEYRSSFTLEAEGFQPLEERLGGPANPTDHTVMEVTCDRTVLLRAKTYDDYTGLNWYDTLSARRYLAVSPRFTALKEELFDMNRPLAGEGNVEALTMQIHMLSAAPTTLYAPGRTRSLQMDGKRMVLYYNMAGEWFLTRDLQPGDAYTLTWLPFAPGDKATEALVAASAGMADSHYADAEKYYMNIPRHMQQEIYDIAARATAGCETPYEKALGIQNYLRENYRYTLHTQVPPEGVDFVAWFLIGEKEGYCTYFATAMTMLCRIAGLPARYVTGYLAVPNDDGMAVVTGEDAHAWTEVYLNGFGWLDFDATPRTDNDRNGPPSDSGQTPPPSEPTPSPSPSPSPSPEPSDAPSPDAAPEETPTPEPQQPDENDAPSPTPPEIPPSPTPETDPSSPENKNAPRFRWWLLLLILLIIALLVLRYLITEPLRQADRHPEQAARVLFSAILALLSLRGLSRLPSETLHDFARRAEKRLREEGLPSLIPLTDAYAAQLYGNHFADAQPFREMYLLLRQKAPKWTRAWLAVKRMLTT